MGQVSSFNTITRKLYRCVAKHVCASYPALRISSHLFHSAMKPTKHGEPLACKDSRYCATSAFTREMRLSTSSIGISCTASHGWIALHLYHLKTRAVLELSTCALSDDIWFKIAWIWSDWTAAKCAIAQWEDGKTKLRIPQPFCPCPP